MIKTLKYSLLTSYSSLGYYSFILNLTLLYPNLSNKHDLSNSIIENHTEYLRFFGLNNKKSQHLCNTGIHSYYKFF